MTDKMLMRYALNVDMSTNICKNLFMKLFGPVYDIQCFLFPL